MQTVYKVDRNNALSVSRVNPNPNPNPNPVSSEYYIESSVCSVHHA